MQQTISLSFRAPGSGLVLEVVTPPDTFFDAVFDDLLTAGGEIQPETLNLSVPLLPELDDLELFLGVQVELCTAVTRQPWKYRALAFQVTWEPFS